MRKSAGCPAAAPPRSHCPATTSGIDDQVVRWNLLSGDGQALEPDHTWDLATPHADYSI